MADPRISHIELDEATILWRNADIEQERRIAIFDLIEENTFRPIRAFEAGHTGPYRLRLSVEDGRLALVIADERENLLETIILGLGRFRRPIRDYFAICDPIIKPSAGRPRRRSRRSTWPGAASTTMRPKCCWNGSTARWRRTSPRPAGSLP
jgi:uncharacterized protein (UPF0262 family)